MIRNVTENGVCPKFYETFCYDKLENYYIFIDFSIIILLLS
jgi:hypothetical protein